MPKGSVAEHVQERNEVQLEIQSAAETEAVLVVDIDVQLLLI